MALETAHEIQTWNERYAHYSHNIIADATEAETAKATAGQINK